MFEINPLPRCDHGGYATEKANSYQLIDDPTRANYRTPADFVIFGQLVRSKTQGGAGYNIVASIYELRLSSLAKLERLKCGQTDPEVLAESFYKGIRETLLKGKLQFNYQKTVADVTAPIRAAILPVWVLGYGDFNVEETADTLLLKAKSGLRVGWPSTDVVDTEEVLKNLEDHGLNQIGNRADAYAENVARFLGADQAVLLHLNSYNSESGTDQWSLGLSTIDIDTGIITRASQKFYSSQQKLLDGAETAAGELALSDYELTAIAQS